ncbi:hypothetical protein [uncultured Endozoicomonas sp.]|uniref:hypothetical protein n=1 Tax=uncultured Endozoicomonas sp. TaxID=432652 RepID=UPI00262DE062|nr:hypothetical protein [uncultured Endozoicomonas sp.]
MISQYSGQREQGIVLISALFFLLLLTTVVAVSVNQTTMSPRMLVNAETKALTFNLVQGDLTTIRLIESATLFRPNNCPNKDDFDPFYIRLTGTGAPARECAQSANGEYPEIEMRALGVASQRHENASGANSISSDYFQTRASRTQSGITTTLVQDMYKAYWMGGDTGQGSGTGVTVDSDANGV